MIIKYNIEVDDAAILSNLDRVGNRIFKLLPDREEGKDWETSLRNLIIEVGGMGSLLSDHVDFFHLLCKMESLLSLNKKDDFMDFRKSIFECLNLVKKVKECL